MTRVVIVGRDAELWLTAAAMARAIGPAGVRIVAVELPTRLSPAAIYASLPALEALHARIGVEEAALLRAVGGAFSLGRRYSGPGSDPFFVPWGSIGTAVAGEAFFPIWLRGRAQGAAAALSCYSLNTTAALGGRMLVPDAQTDAFGRADYGYHLPGRAYAGVLKGAAARLGVELHQAAHVSVEHAADDLIASVELPGGRRLTADMFVDASGAEALLSRERRTPGAHRRILARAPALRQPPPFAEMRVHADGWLCLHATLADTRIEGVCRADVPAEESVAAFAAAVAMPLADVAVEPLAAPVPRAPWNNNCVAIGTAAWPCDPMNGVALHVAQLGIVHLLSLFPASDVHAAERAEYNRLLLSSFARIADYQHSVYASAPWTGRFWLSAQATPISPELAHTIATFRARGDIPAREDESISSDAWQALLFGLGITPESWSPTADRPSPEALDDALAGMMRFVAGKVAAQPGHAAYLAETVGAAA